ncbi:hypothetical protein EG329_005909 [Mollisiaceae sp. DMI_Dod_QoI]|nr:hypothetical protein EG329_005909 [Helotiales sp. DMI_Dod_QoI]
MLFVFSTLLLAGLAAGACDADNCLRALRATQTPGRLQSAQSFCGTYTTKAVLASAIPAFAVDACKDSNGNFSLKLSSACNCIAASPTLSKTSISTKLSTTVASTTLSTTTAGPTATGACALVSISSRAQKSTAPSATPTVAASLAKACLNSVPLNKTAALALVAAMEPYLEWQSDSAFLRDPPADYFYPPHDIFAYLASVKTNLQNDKYANEYEFQEDLYQVFARAHDGHFVFYPDVLTKAIEWGRQRSLVSISEDGKSLPVIKLYEDVIAGANASVVTQINGEDAATYVANFAYTASFNQDADAAYNTMFFEKAFVGGATGTGYFNGGGRVRYIYPGDNTTFTFANGSSLTVENVGKVKGDFTGVTDGASFYKKFVVVHAGSTGAVDSAEADAFVPEILVPGYPSPVVITNDSVVSGYYLNGAGYEDVAVISLLAFESESPYEFQQVAQQFFADALRDGKTKLVIDLSANGGGYILQGYDLFRQLFPDIVQDGNSRWRENPAYLAIAEIESKLSAGFNPLTSSNNIINIAESVFNYRYDLNTSNEPFLTFEDKFAPHVYKGDNFTSLMRWNLNDSLTTSNDTYGLGADITGYGTRTNFTQPFEADNIIMLLDGYCASTCTLFTEFMRTQAGIKSIAMGGRPKEGPIQGVGGIKGAQILGWADIYSNAQTALRNNATAEQAAILSKLTTLPAQRSSSTGINVRDNILPDNVDDGLPAQFVFEEADCRLYYTKPMITDVTALWKAAADAAFNGGNCAHGGLSKREPTKRSAKRRGVPIKRTRHAQRAIITEQNQAWVARHGRKAIP